MRVRPVCVSVCSLCLQWKFHLVLKVESMLLCFAVSASRWRISAPSKLIKTKRLKGILGLWARNSPQFSCEHIFSMFSDLVIVWLLRTLDYLTPILYFA